MAKVVRVKVIQTGAVKPMSELAAQRLVTANPKEYVLVEPPTIEVTSLPPLQKKSVEVVGGSQSITNQKTTQQTLSK